MRFLAKDHTQNMDRYKRLASLVVILQVFSLFFLATILYTISSFVVVVFVNFGRRRPKKLPATAHSAGVWTFPRSRRIVCQSGCCRTHRVGRQRSARSRSVRQKGADSRDFGSCLETLAAAGSIRRHLPVAEWCHRGSLRPSVVVVGYPFARLSQSVRT